MRFIKEHKGIIASILIFLILIILVIFSYKNSDKQGSIFSVVTQTVATIDEPIYSITGKVKNAVVGVFSVGQIRKENEELKEKVEKLEKTIVEQQMQESELAELRELSSALNYNHIQKAENYVSADIVAMDNSNIFNRFTINAGEKQGVVQNAIVVNGDGLVGRIEVAGSGYSKVVSIIDEQNSVSFMVQRDMSIIGVARGNGKGSLEGFTIDGKAEIIKGDVIVTSGMGMYPAGIKIGKISKVKYSNDTQLKTLEVKTSVNFKKIQKVLVAQ